MSFIDDILLFRVKKEFEDSGAVGGGGGGGGSFDPSSLSTIPDEEGCVADGGGGVGSGAGVGVLGPDGAAAEASFYGGPYREASKSHTALNCPKNISLFGATLNFFSRNLF